MAFDTDSIQKNAPTQVEDSALEKGDTTFRLVPGLDRKVVLKLDLFLMPVMIIIFILLFLDRANIGNARVAGLQKDLRLTDFQFQTGNVHLIYIFGRANSISALTITYVPYILIEIPSNLVMKKIGPRIMLPGLCICWGIVTIFHCLIKNYAGLLTARFFLGLFEGGLFPGFVLFLSDFYRRDEIQKRVGLIYGAASVSGAFSGLLSAAFQKMEGLGHLHGWQWIFLLEGIITVLFGAFSLWHMPNNPTQVRAFTAEQADYCIARLAADQPAEETSKITAKIVLSAFKEPHIIIIAVASFCNGVVIGGLSYFTPSIVKALGYGAIHTQLLSVPPYACAFVVTMVAATYADRYHRRGLAALCTLSLGIVGCALNLTCTSTGARYTAICLNVTALYASAPCILSWIPNNSATYGKRSTAIAIGFVVSNSGGIIATWIYPTTDAPRYLNATRVNLSLICLEMATALLLLLLLSRLNKRKVERREQLLAGVEHLSMEEQMEELGDHHPDFKYTL